MSLERFYDETILSGIAFGYAASKKGYTGGYYIYNLMLAGDCFERRKEMRSFRLERSAAGKKLPQIQDDTLQDDLMVFFGPKMSPSDAVSALSQVINRIKENGLMLGRNARDEDVKERMNGEVEVCK